MLQVSKPDWKNQGDTRREGEDERFKKWKMEDGRWKVSGQGSNIEMPSCRGGQRDRLLVFRLDLYPSPKKKHYPHLFLQQSTTSKSRQQFRWIEKGN